jgi:hypothetical protein
MGARQGAWIAGLTSRLRQGWSRFDLAASLEWASRLGYAARGLVYLGLGAIVFLAAVDWSPRAHGAQAMLALWAKWPLGLVIIALVGLGLSGFAAWRALQAIFDADRHGVTPNALAIRAGQAISGLVYGGLALSAFELLDVFEDVGEADEEQSAQQWVASLMSLPHGDLLVMSVGAILLGVGVGNLVQALAQDFSKRLACDERVCRWVVPLARAGYSARGLATLPLGVFLAKAGLETRSSDARSWGGALQAVEGRPFGSLILACLAVGLMAFGAFGIVEAIFRRIAPPADII